MPGDRGTKIQHENSEKVNLVEKDNIQVQERATQ